jgi:hypothetical protein
MKYQFRFSFVLLFLLMSISFNAQSPIQATYHNPVNGREVSNKMIQLFSANPTETKEILLFLDENWNDGYIPMLLDVMYMSRAPFNKKPIVSLLEKQTHQNYGGDVHAWLEWLWNEDFEVLPYYGDWMAQVYENIDYKFRRYFKNQTETATIRLEEVRWGGVKQDGIPPLRQPKMLAAEEAKYLKNDNIVFGISINGDHRAYPKRILAWHEMFVDEIGGASIAGVYCTLCGTVIAYNTEFAGENHDLGTSGFLYRSNKLMYDKATQSLWNTIEGKPVIGPLADSDIELASHSVVTTTWGAWKKLHPETKVLSLETGHQRDYGEGVAYQNYFATDGLMFNVPKLDERLRNKDEVLIVRTKTYKDDPLAISVKFLKKNRVYQDKIGNTRFVVLTDKSGANRVFNSGEVIFEKMMNNTVKDSTGKLWEIDEEKLVSEDGQVLSRLPYHRMFWFAWFNTFEETRLVY